MKLDVGTYVVCQPLNGGGFASGTVEDLTEIGISLESLNPDELPTHVFVPWTNVGCIHTFKNEEDMLEFFNLLAMAQ